MMIDDDDQTLRHDTRLSFPRARWCTTRTRPERYLQSRPARASCTPRTSSPSERVARMRRVLRGDMAFATSPTGRRRVQRALATIAIPCIKAPVSL